MSTLKVTNIKHASSGSNNIVLNADGSTTIASGVGKILQVVSSHKVDLFSTTSSSFVDITGLSRTITPIAASSKIHVIVSIHVGAAQYAYPTFNVLRGSTIITQGTNASGNRTNCSFGTYIATEHITQTLGFTFLDSPSYSLSDTLTYKIQVASKYNSLEVNINSNNSEDNNAWSLNGTSTITLMEVAA